MDKNKKDAVKLTVLSVALSLICTAVCVCISKLFKDKNNF